MAVLQLAQKVTPRYDAEFNAGKGLEPRWAPGKVEIETEDGVVYSKRLDLPYGHSDKPIIWEDLIAKFRDCLSYSAKVQ